MSEHDTQPLVAEQVPLEEAYPDLYQKRTVEQYLHIHGPFTFLMNQNHNALRGCTTCGQAWVGSMAGAASDLVWHPVSELPEEE